VDDDSILDVVSDLVDRYLGYTSQALKSVLTSSKCAKLGISLKTPKTLDAHILGSVFLFTAWFI
jgi:hypothetical protein